MVYALQLLFLLSAILCACLVFANAIENLGNKLNLGNEITGSILAAVGTALPETIVPLVAVYMAAQGQENGAKHGIAIGSIIGAPFLLSTLALFLIGLTMLIHRRKRRSLNLAVNHTHVKRDIYYFLVIFIIALSASHGSPIFKIAAATLLGLGYALYVFQTIRAHDSNIAAHEEALSPELYLKRLKLPDNLFFILVQCIIGLVAIVFFAEKFVHALESAATLWDISPLILSLIITPIATELPEKVNSCVWVSESKDSLAMGNITGAMVFQASIPCTIGILFTDWHLSALASLCAGLAILGSLILLASLHFYKKINAYVLLLAGSLYLIYIGTIIFT
jgi:cation:H+ antiporter